MSSSHGTSDNITLIFQASGPLQSCYRTLTMLVMYLYDPSNVPAHSKPQQLLNSEQATAQMFHDVSSPVCYVIQTAPVYSCSATHKDFALIHVKLEASLRSLLDRQYSETQLCSLLSTAHFTSALLVETYRRSEWFRTTVQNENCRTTTQEIYAWNISYVTPVKTRKGNKKRKMVPSTPWTYTGGVEMSLHSSTHIREMSGQPQTPEALPAKKENPLNGDWVGLTAELY
jgi:hypothetical protein